MDLPLLHFNQFIKKIRPTNSKRKLIEATADKQKITPVNDNKFRTTTGLVMQIELKKWSYHCPGED